MVLTMNTLTRRTIRGVATATLMLPLVASVGVAQRAPVADAASPGWIGISFDVSGDRSGRAVEVVIVEVRPGSPAEAAGLRAGDRVVSINDLDSPSELASLSERLHLKEGDRVSVNVERDGRSLRMRLRAAKRPAEFAMTTTTEFSFRTDSMVDTWVRAMDSLRVQLVEERGQDVRLHGTPAPVRGRIAVVTESGAGSGVRAPFEFFIFRGEEHDSLRQEMLDLNDLVGDLEVRLVRREGELRRVMGGQSESRFEQDAEFRRLETALTEAARRSSVLEATMAENARENAGPAFTLRVPRGQSVIRTGAAPAPEFRPLTPYLVGRNRVAGAEVVDLQPELAEYFKVDAGILVLEVAPGTPASMAGIVPGDVITRLDQVSVRSVEDFRFGVSQAGETLPISLIRQGASIQVLLRR